MSLTYAPMTIDHYEEVVSLWRGTEGVSLHLSDSREGTARFLERNPGMSSVALDGGRIVGAVLCCHDGRRGYISHLAVLPSHRRHGVGRALVDRCVEALLRENIEACNLFVWNSNTSGIAFWRSQGWAIPDTWSVMHRRLIEM